VFMVSCVADALALFHISAPGEHGRAGPAMEPRESEPPPSVPAVQPYVPDLPTLVSIVPPWESAPRRTRDPGPGYIPAWKVNPARPDGSSRPAPVPIELPNPQTYRPMANP
jgi:hypothetical protein